MRQQSIDLRNEGRYEQSWSEAIDANGGEGGGGGGGRSEATAAYHPATANPINFFPLSLSVARRFDKVR